MHHANLIIGMKNKTMAAIRLWPLVRDSPPLSADFCPVGRYPLSVGRYSRYKLCQEYALLIKLTNMAYQNLIIMMFLLIDKDSGTNGVVPLPVES